MYAILQQSGHQYRISPGDRLLVDRLAAEVGSVVALEPVVLVQGDSGSPTVGTPVVDGARVAATVVSHPKGGKIRVFKYKPKKRYRRTHGHRSLLTELRVEAVLAAGEALPERKVAAEAPAKPAATSSPTTKAAATPSSTTEARPRGRTKAQAADAPEATAPETEVSPAPEATVSPADEAAEISSPTTKSRPRSRAKAPVADAPEAPSADTGAEDASPAAEAASEPETPKRRTRAKKPDTEPEA